MKLSALFIAVASLITTHGRSLEKEPGSLSLPVTTSAVVLRNSSGELGVSIGEFELPVDVESTLKDLIMFGIGHIPAVGSVLNIFIGNFWNIKKETNIVDDMEPFVRQWILDQSLTNLKSSLSGYMKSIKECLTAAAEGFKRKNRRSGFEQGALVAKLARNRITEERTEEVYVGIISWLVPIAVLEVTSLRGAWAYSKNDTRDARARIQSTMKEYTSEFDKIVDMYNSLTGDSNNKMGIYCYQDTNQPYMARYVKTRGYCTHKAFKKEVSFSAASTFGKWTMANTLAMVKDRFQKETIITISKLYFPIFNISMADPEDQLSEPKAFAKMDTLWTGPMSPALLFGAGFNYHLSNNAITDSMVSAFSGAQVISGKMIGFKYCIYDDTYNGDHFIQSFRVIFDTGVSKSFEIGFDWVGKEYLRCGTTLSSFGEIIRVSFSGSTHANRGGYRLFSIGYGGIDQPPGEYTHFGDNETRDSVSHSIESPGGNYRLRHFKVASVQNQPSVFEFGFQWEN